LSKAFTTASVPYNGWVQQLPQSWKALLTPAQINLLGR
jgi:hypothetical protein